MIGSPLQRWRDCGAGQRPRHSGRATTAPGGTMRAMAPELPHERDRERELNALPSPSRSPDRDAVPGRRQGARLLAGAPIAAEMRGRVRDGVASFSERHGFPPTLAVVIIGADAPSAVYLHQIVRSCRSTGVTGRIVEIGERVTTALVQRRIDELNRDPLVSGIIVQMPLPKRIPLRAVIEAIDPRKDIDGLQPENAGLLTLGYEGFLPATAQAAVEIVKRSGYRLEGLDATVVGRSNVVGKPVSLLLQREDCTVTMCHRRTRDLATHVTRADLVVVAAGSPGLITGAM
ncbi:MAG: bifunctional 5,10-methylenetetrahydrofolate dehydrogenase/5,10-methenyltetrahydrofolate cyclohydrolase, partial [Chloroflexi bacterium]|nr:bifunctional 5,10-methylenetetrahydrofolate dehydrogenase/5,10-methenyltetrahydrofolate cyclohydrolase [Chloroflexota bacterium]